MISIVIIFILCFFMSLLSINFFWIESYGNEFISLNPNFCFIVYVIICIAYLLRFRRKNIFCFEIFFFIIFGIVTFYLDLIVPYLVKISPVVEIYSSKYKGNIHNMSFYLQLVSICSFMLGSIIQVNCTKSNYTNKCSSIIQKERLNQMTSLSTFFLIVFWGYLLASGTVFSWFHYSNSSVDYSNTEIVFLTVIFLVITVLEFNRLELLYVRSVKIFLKEVNKMYLVMICVSTLLLLLSGNRNESVLIFLPFFVSYNIHIKKINGKYLALGVILGWIVMYMVGLSRHDGIENFSINSYEYSLLESSKDFAAAGICTDYLVQYTNANGPVYFLYFLKVLFSSVPFLGGIASNFLDIDSGIRSAFVTTDGMQMAYNMSSGLGTSLVGDLYYTASFFFVVVFFFVLGFFMSYCHSELIEKKNRNLIVSISYVLMFGNVLYYPRAEWTMPFRYIGLSIVMLLMINFFCQYKGKKL